MKEIISFAIGALLGTIVMFFVSTSIQLQNELRLARLQGSIDVVNLVAPGLLEKAGLVKEKKDGK